MTKDEIEVKSFGTVFPKKSMNARIPYQHQKNAMENLDIMNESTRYSTMIVLPTGGGKTYTASMWLLKNAIDCKKKILWIAHRQMLLEQAAESFQKFAYSEIIPHIPSFQYRIISGASNHDRAVNIQDTDNLLIASKDSLGRNLSCLDSWLSGEQELFLIIDEAHHSTAKTYRKVIAYVQERVPNVKLIGLTATPFRTGDDEQGLLGKIFTDGVQNGTVIHGNSGITYKIDLKELINRRILSKPILETYNTEEIYGESLGLDGWESIQRLDTLPEDVAGQMADSAARNKLIVNTYLSKPEEYGQTIVFAINIIHAIHLNTLFNKAGIACEYIVSDVRDCVTGIRISREENERKIEDYRLGKIQVLINVNILTEGVDLPQTKTVFLTRPTVSTILMTQMIGRALRGKAAGGTDSAYIVFFIDRWDEHIAWVNPDNLFCGNNEFTDNPAERTNQKIRMIAISKIEEFASVLDDSVDTEALERVPFIQRIPIGMYAFTYLEESGVDSSYQVMVYDSTQKAYEEMMDMLPALFESFDCTQEYPSKELLNEMAAQCRDTFFLGEMIPPYEEKDVIQILKYYAQYDAPPQFYLFDDIDRNKLDISIIAKCIWDEQMTPMQKAEYLNSLWECGDENLLKLFFGRRMYFWKQIDIELGKLSGVYDEEQNVQYGTRSLNDLPLFQIREINPALEKMIRDSVFERSKDKDGNYTCASCGKKGTSRILFQVDHIKPLNKGGKTFPNNLQILCRQCNGIKGDKFD